MNKPSPGLSLCLPTQGIPQPLFPGTPCSERCCLVCNLLALAGQVLCCGRPEGPSCPICALCGVCSWVWSGQRELLPRQSGSRRCVGLRGAVQAQVEGWQEQGAVGAHARGWSWSLPVQQGRRKGSCCSPWCCWHSLSPVILSGVQHTRPAACVSPGSTQGLGAEGSWDSGSRVGAARPGQQPPQYQPGCWHQLGHFHSRGMWGAVFRENLEPLARKTTGRRGRKENP